MGICILENKAIECEKILEDKRLHFTCLPVFENSTLQ